MARIHRRPVQKRSHDQDNHDGVITHLEPDILVCEVKWALESITTNKASGGYGIPLELFQILKDDAVKVLHSRCFIEYAKAFDCVDHNKLGNSERDGNTRPPDLPFEKSVCRSGSNS